VAVEVRIPTVFRRFTGGESSVELEPGTVSNLIEQLEQRYPGMGEQILTPEGDLHRFINIYVNDEDARYLEKLDTKVTDGDTVSLLPSVAGGAV
jgi:MoaD family protein